MKNKKSIIRSGFLLGCTFVLACSFCSRSLNKDNYVAYPVTEKEYNYLTLMMVATREVPFNGGLLKDDGADYGIRGCHQKFGGGKYEIKLYQKSSGERFISFMSFEGHVLRFKTATLAEYRKKALEYDQHLVGWRNNCSEPTWMNVPAQ